MSFQTLQQSFKMFKERVKRPESLGVYLGNVGERDCKAHHRGQKAFLPVPPHCITTHRSSLEAYLLIVWLWRQEMQGQVVIMKGHRLKWANTFARPSSSPGKPHPHKRSCSSVANFFTCLSTLFFFKIILRYLFIYVWLNWVFIAACGLSLAAESRAWSSCGAQASHCGGFSCPEHRL